MVDFNCGDFNRILDSSKYQYKQNNQSLPNEKKLQNVTVVLRWPICLNSL